MLCGIGIEKQFIDCIFVILLKIEHQIWPYTDKRYIDKSLFVSSIGGLEQNVNLLLTPVSGTVFHALLHGNMHFVLHGSLVNRLFQIFLLAVV